MMRIGTTSPLAPHSSAPSQSSAFSSHRHPPAPIPPPHTDPQPFLPSFILLVPFPPPSQSSAFPTHPHPSTPHSSAPPNPQPFLPTLILLAPLPNPQPFLPHPNTPRSPFLRSLPNLSLSFPPASSSLFISQHVLIPFLGPLPPHSSVSSLPIPPPPPNPQPYLPSLILLVPFPPPPPNPQSFLPTLILPLPIPPPLPILNLSFPPLSSSLPIPPVSPRHQPFLPTLILLPPHFLTCSHPIFRSPSSSFLYLIPPIPPPPSNPQPFLPSLILLATLPNPHPFLPHPPPPRSPFLRPFPNLSLPFPPSSSSLLMSQHALIPFLGLLPPHSSVSSVPIPRLPLSPISTPLLRSSPHFSASFPSIPHPLCPISQAFPFSFMVYLIYTTRLSRIFGFNVSILKCHIIFGYSCCEQGSTSNDWRCTPEDYYCNEIGLLNKGSF